MEAVAIAAGTTLAKEVANNIVSGLSTIEQLTSDDEVLAFKEGLERTQDVIKKDSLEYDKQIWSALYDINAQIVGGLYIINLFIAKNRFRKIVAKKRILEDLKKINENIKKNLSFINTAKISRADKNIQEICSMIYQNTIVGIKSDISHVRENDEEEHSLNYIDEEDIILPKGNENTICTTYLGREVIVKKIGRFDDPDTVGQINKEIAFMNALRKHKGILRYYGRIQTAHNDIYIVVENLRNNDMTIRSALDNNELSTGRKGMIIMKLIDSVQMIHAANIVLKYLNSRTILLDRFDYPKLIEIGKGKWKGSPTVKSIDAGDGNKWCAREVTTVDVVSTKKADIYSLGIILWEFITQKTPFESIGLREYGKIKRDEEELKDYFKIDHPLNNIIAQCLSFQPEKRPNIEDLKIQVGRFML